MSDWWRQFGSKRRNKDWGVKFNGSTEFSPDTDKDTAWESHRKSTTCYEISSLSLHSSLQRCPSSYLYLIPLPIKSFFFQPLFPCHPLQFPCFTVLLSTLNLSIVLSLSPPSVSTSMSASILSPYTIPSWQESSAFAKINWHPTSLRVVRVVRH